MSAPLKAQHSEDCECLPCENKNLRESVAALERIRRTQKEEIRKCKHDNRQMADTIKMFTKYLEQLEHRIRQIDRDLRE